VKRRFFNALAGVSLVACVAIAALWGRAYWSWDTLVLSTRWNSSLRIINIPLYLPQNDYRPQLFSFPNLVGKGIWVINGPGFIELHVDYTDASVPLKKAQSASRFFLERDQINPALRSLRTPPEWNPHGFKFARNLSANPGGAMIQDLNIVYSYAVSDWLLLLMFAVLPTLWVVRRAFTLRPPAGYCRSCGYDLRATPDRCPECGTVPAKAEISI
jgi:hypothetical protein